MEIQDLQNCKLKDITEDYSLLVKEAWGGGSTGYRNLHEISTIRKGKTITEKTAIDGDVPVIAGGRDSPYNHNESNHPGNVITVSASGAYSGYVWYHKEPIWASDCTVIKSADENKYLTRYLYYCLKAKQADIYKKQRGTGQPHVYMKDLKDFPIPVWSIDDQREFVSRMEDKEAQMQSLRLMLEDIEGELITDIEAIYCLEV